jgi:hypothetical protein
VAVVKLAGHLVAGEELVRELLPMPVLFLAGQIEAIGSSFRKYLPWGLCYGATHKMR